MSRYEWKKPRNLTLGAVLVSITVIIQASPLYLPVVGISLSALSTLPVALASYYNGTTGFLTYLSAGVLLFFWNVPQAVIFLFSSGLLGVILGVLIRCKLPLITVITVPALVITLGIILAGTLLGIPVFPWLTGFEKIFILPVMLLCCVVYTSVWVPVLAAIITRLRSFLGDEEADHPY